VQVKRQHVIDVLRKAGLPDVAEDADQLLPDPIDYDDAASFLARYGISKDELISRVGGSPLPTGRRRYPAGQAAS
jgi:hypothetical protein